MVEARPESGDEWGDGGEDNDGWDDWDYGEEVNVDFEEPGLGRKASSFDNASDIYST